MTLVNRHWYSAWVRKWGGYKRVSIMSCVSEDTGPKGEKEVGVECYEWGNY